MVQESNLFVVHLEVLIKWTWRMLSCWKDTVRNVYQDTAFVLLGIVIFMVLIHTLYIERGLSILL